MESSPRHVAVLIAYRLREDGQFEVFMQERGPQAPRFPNMVGFFGGGIEQGETPEMGLMREIREELCFDVPEIHFFKRYDAPEFVINVFTLSVGADFETHVRVMEGEKGIFLSEQEVTNHSRAIPHDRQILLDVFSLLKNK